MSSVKIENITQYFSIFAVLKEEFGLGEKLKVFSFPFTLNRKVLEHLYSLQITTYLISYLDVYT